MAPTCQPPQYPRCRIHLEDFTDPATVEFLKLPNLAHILQDAIDEVHKYLYEFHGTPQAVRSITLILESIDGVAQTNGTSLDDLHKEIHFSLKYLGSLMRDQRLFRDECTGVVVHEMVHCWQHNGCGTAPGGLIEGIADFVRLKVGLYAPGWKRGREGLGKRWDEGYSKTAFFLEWLEDVYGEGSVGRINDRLDGKPYKEDEFWYDLFGASVDKLWENYVEHFDEEAKATSKTKSPVDLFSQQSESSSRAMSWDIVESTP